MRELPEVRSVLPHRPPMLMVDKLLSINEEGCTALKNISHSEPCFQGHFPEAPIFPGVLTLEALGQVCAVWLAQQSSGKLPLLTGVDNARFHRKIVPGDQIKLVVSLQKAEKGFYSFDVAALTDGLTACTATMTLALR